MKHIYFDHASSVPVYDEIISKIHYRNIGNAAGLHYYGRNIKNLLEASRAKVAKAFHRNIEDVIFTSGATEANNLIVHGIAKHIDLFIVDSTSHPSGLFPVMQHKHILWPVHSNGLLNEDFLYNALEEHKNKKICIVLTTVNHMTGVYQNVDLTKAHSMPNVVIHTDFAQAMHKAHNYEMYDSLTISGHKIGAPIGIGALIINQKMRDIPLERIMHGGKMEWNYRPGSVNYIYAEALAEALHIPYIHPSHETFETQIKAHGGVIVGDATERSTSISCVIMPGVENVIQLHELDKQCIAVSIGSGCTPNDYIFDAMGYNQDAKYAIRISSGPQNIQEDFDVLLKSWLSIQNKYTATSR